MTKSKVLTTAAITLGMLVVFAIMLSNAGTKARQSSAPNVLGTPDSNESVTYFIAEGKASVGYRPGDRELALWAFQAWQRSAGKNLRFEPASESAALVRLLWAQPGGGEYG